MKKTLLLLVALVVAAVAMAHSQARRDIAANHNRSGSNHYAYPYPATRLPALTAAPAGYEPFYIDHYGRHGSRWLTGMSGYNRPVRTLQKLDSLHLLNRAGEELLATMQRVATAARGRAGDLSDVGAEQHRGIAERMCRNFPQVFGGDAWVDARSTEVKRCILSMGNETGAISAFNPQAKITMDASLYDMPVLGWGHGEDTLCNVQRKQLRSITDSLYFEWLDAGPFMARITRDTSFVDDNYTKCLRLMLDVFNVAGSLQNHHVFSDLDLYSYFTDEEIFDLWRTQNVKWYTQWANSVQGGNRMPFISRALLADMLATAREAIAHPDSHGASLRFGHDTCILPLLCLLETDNVNYSTADLDNLHLYWRNYEIIPKAANVQIVFYRRTGSDDVLLKVLVNEHEATLPLPADMAPYYHWHDFDEYYSQKLLTPVEWPR